MTTKPSSAPCVDGPYKLIPTPKKYMTEADSFVQVASEMTGSHNCLLRGLNAILLQAPHIAASDDAANHREQDVKDLLFYVDSWVKMVDHHHHTEETCIFPKIAAMAGEPDLLNHAEDQHKEFHSGLAALGKYTTTMQDSPDNHSWSKMKQILDSFTEPLTKHLYDEVEEFISFKRLDSDGLARCWKDGEDVAKAEGSFRILLGVWNLVASSPDR